MRGSRSRARPPCRSAGATIAAAAIWIGVAGGCPSFDDPSTVKDLRALAVGVEPSEIILAVTELSDLSSVTIPAITLTPLVVDPEGQGRPLLVDVSACANQPGGQEPPNSGGDPGFPSGGARTTIGSTLCDGAPTELGIASGVDLGTNPSVVASLDPAWIMDAFARDVFIGPDGRVHGGFDLGMPIVFQITARAGTETVKSIKRALFWASAVSADQQANATPRIPDVSAYDQRDEATAEPLDGARRQLVEGTVDLVPAGGLWIDPAPADAESYVTAVLDRNTGEAIPHVVSRETLTYTFFATVGTFSPFETRNQQPGITTATRIHIESKYQPPPVGDAPIDVTIWIVVRDERGGTSWVTRALQVQGLSPSVGGGARP